MDANEFRAAILRCAANAQADEPIDTSARARRFCARLIGAMWNQHEPDVERALAALIDLPADPDEAAK